MSAAFGTGAFRVKMHVKPLEIRLNTWVYAGSLILRRMDTLLEEVMIHIEI